MQKLLLSPIITMVIIIPLPMYLDYIVQPQLLYQSKQVAAGAVACWCITRQGQDN